MDQSLKFLASGGVPVFRQNEGDYERAVLKANMLYRLAKPACVIQPETPEHVRMIVKQAKSNGLKITIKYSSHSYADRSTASDGILLDLGRMNNVDLDVPSNTVTIGAGCRWSEVYLSLIDGKHDGLIINGGRCPDMGVSGYILGGGLGPFTRSFGMGCDTLKEVSIVTAQGELCTVKDSDQPGYKKARLFWALCGSGGGNYGIVVQMKLNLMQLKSKDKTVVAGKYDWFPKSKEARSGFMTTMNNFYTADWPREMTIDSTWLCDLRDNNNTDIGVRFTIYYDGDVNSYRNLIDKYIEDSELSEQLKQQVQSEKSTRFLKNTLALQWSEEAKRADPTRAVLGYTLYSSFIFDHKTKSNIGEVTAIIKKEMINFRREFEAEQVEFQTTWIHSGGKASDRKPTDTAFFWREGTYHMYIMVEWDDERMEEDMRAFFKRVKRQLRPFSLQGRAASINFPDSTLHSKGYEKAYFGGNFAGVKRIKRSWDNDDFFRWDQSVKLPEEISGRGGGVGVDESDDDTPGAKKPNTNSRTQGRKKNTTTAGKPSAPNIPGSSGTSSIISGTSTASDISGTSGTPGTSSTPGTLKKTGTPGGTSTSSTPSISGTPDIPSISGTPSTPSASSTPGASGAPGTPGKSSISNTSGIKSSTPSAPGAPGMPSTLGIKKSSIDTSGMNYVAQKQWDYYEPDDIENDFQELANLQF
ncbi:putative berberine family protein [Rosellinia necatrix]|uniref:Putative berberine family protein n=1 Tax=Rosellinia necatrix TaxID=77044 RepID=A0A1S7UPA3_ROSNE|nr:putative berberine family protein [Rosellinia necatrix]